MAGLVAYLVLVSVFLVCYLGIEFGKWRITHDRDNSHDQDH